MEVWLKSLQRVRKGNRTEIFKIFDSLRSAGLDGYLLLVLCAGVKRRIARKESCVFLRGVSSNDICVVEFVCRVVCYVQ